MTIGLLPEALVVKRVHETNTSITNRDNDALLLRALRRSIERKRRAAPG